MVDAEPGRRRSSIFESDQKFRYLDSLITIFVVILLISNVVGQKISAFGPLRVSGARILFPITYIFGDVFTEVYGYAASRKAIWFGFFASALLSLMSLLCVKLPPAPEWHNQQAFETVFYTVPRLVIASLIAYWCGAISELLHARQTETCHEGPLFVEHRTMARPLWARRLIPSW